MSPYTYARKLTRRAQRAKLAKKILRTPSRRVKGSVRRVKRRIRFRGLYSREVKRRRRERFEKAKQPLEEALSDFIDALLQEKHNMSSKDYYSLMDMSILILDPEYTYRIVNYAHKGLIYSCDQLQKALRTVWTEDKEDWAGLYAPRIWELIVKHVPPRIMARAQAQGSTADQTSGAARLPIAANLSVVEEKKRKEVTHKNHAQSGQDQLDPSEDLGKPHDVSLSFLARGQDAQEQNGPSYFSNFHTQAAVDEEIARCFASVQSLRTRRNSLAPISKLPTEIIARFFWFCIPALDSAAERYPYSQALRITHICRAWREIALDEASLWTVISSENEQLAEEFVRRSKSAPLDLRLAPKTKAKRLATYLRHLGRARTLSPRNPENEPPPKVGSLMCAPTPLLESVSLTSGRVDRPLPDGLFGLHAPSLRRLSLERCLANWRLIIVPSLVGCLRHLSLVNCSPVVKLSARDIALGLAQMPFLESFVFTDIRYHAPMLYPALDGADHLLRPTVLRRLSLLRLAGELNIMSKLLDNLSIPKRAKLDLTLYVSRNPEGGVLDLDLATIHGVLAANRVTDKRSCLIRRLTVGETARSSPLSSGFPVKIQAWTPHDPADVPSFSLRFSLPSATQPSESSITQSICSMLSLRGLRNLQVIDVADAGALLAQILPHTKRLSMISLQGPGADTLVRFLAPKKAHYSWSTATGKTAQAPRLRHHIALVPALRELTLTGADMGGLDSSGLHKALPGMLRRRRAKLRRGIVVNLVKCENLGRRNLLEMGSALKLGRHDGDEWDWLKWDDYEHWDSRRGYYDEYNRFRLFDEESDFESDD